MAIKSYIQDGEGTSTTAGVTRDHELKVTSRPISLTDVYDGGSGDLSIYTRTKIFVSTLKNSSDSEDLNVDGSVTPVEFYIAAEPDKLKSIHHVRFVIHDTQTALGSSEGRRFCSAAASPGLTNGLEFYIEQGGITTHIFNNPVKNIASFLNFTDDYINEPGALGAGLDLLTIQINFTDPINIVPGGIDTITVKISDDLTEIDLFNIIAFGSQELLET